ncbi:MAG: hypothetical protein PHP26_08560, partial [Syntrophomonas sp.]|nr:hypothetical protein [Syntrophomonas sp.]
AGNIVLINENDYNIIQSYIVKEQKQIPIYYLLSIIYYLLSIIYYLFIFQHDYEPGKDGGLCFLNKAKAGADANR